MRKLYFLFAVFTILFSMSLRAQNQVTVANDTAIHGMIPVWGERTQMYQHSQVLYPASMLTGAAGRFITSITFYLLDNGDPAWTATFKVGLKVVSESSIDASFISANPTTVYTGAFAVLSGNTMTIQFNSPFAYNGGNLLLDISSLSSGSYNYDVESIFYGTNSTASSIIGVGWSAQEVGYTQVQDFIPKTTFTLADPCTPANLTVSNITGNSALVSWEENPSGAGQYYELSYQTGGGAWIDCPGNITSDHYLLSGLTPDMLYNLRLRAHCNSGYSDWLTTSFSTTCIGGEDIQTVTVGSGESSDYGYGECFPVYTSYNYSYTQQIFTAAEIGDATTIRQLDVQFIYPSATRNVDIYLGHTTADAFANGSDWVPAENLTLVYSGQITFANTGGNYWFNIPFTTPFAYNGTDNLVVVFDDNTGEAAYWGEKVYMHECSANRSICAYSYSTDFTPTNTESGFTTEWRMNTRFTTTSCSTDGCDRGNVAVGSITGSSAQLLFVPGAGASNFELQYSADGSSFTNLNATTSPYQLTGLMQNTTYTVRIRSNCAGGWSAWKTIQFTTGTNNYTRLYVKPNGTGDGASWANACNDLNWALNTAALIKEASGVAPDIWVAQGVYYGDTNATSAFTMVNGVNVYGGFIGNESANYDLSQRDFTAHPTILDGQEARRVINQPAAFANETVWDGFTVRNGFAAGYGMYSGGGGACLRDNVVFRHCRFTHNTANNAGGGVFVESQFIPTFFENCEFTYNTSNDAGGGLYCSNAIATHCVFTHNTASYTGGGVCISTVPESMATLSNCLVANNTADNGAGIHSYAYYTVLENTTVVNNEALGYAAGVGSYTYITLNNCILWGNRCNGNASNLETSDPATCAYTALEGGYPGEGNITLLPESILNGAFSPKFVHPSAGVGYTDATDNVDWHLQQGSVCVNRGSDSLVTIASNTDMDGGARIRHGQVDLGCYESDYDATVLPSFGDILYVTQTGAGNHDGSSWGNAMEDLSLAVTFASLSGGDVWVAEGVYYGDTTASNAITLMDGVDLYGGFAGNEPANFDLSMRNIAAHPTILDGQNARRVILQPTYFSTETVLDGFTVRNGYTNEDGGGACLFGNTVVRHCRFTHNTGYSGGGLSANATVVQHCEFTHNHASNNGGGLCVYNASQSNAVVSNCLVANNTANYYGGGIYVNSNNAIVENTTVVHNTSMQKGGGLCSSYGNYVYNSILWGNRCNGNVNNLDLQYNSTYYTIYCLYSAVEGGFTGEGNILLESENILGGSYSPKFVNPSLIAGYTDNTPDADWHLMEGSICVNRGNDSLVTIPSNTDLDGVARIRHGQVDLGCYESDYETAVLPTFSNVVYVTPTGAGELDGTSWENAMNDIQSAMATAHTHNADVWVAEGVYYGDTTAGNAFTMVDGINVYGGFAGNEPDDYDLSLRDFTAHPTILDGQNARRVLNQETDFTAATTWDGFTVRNGYSTTNGGGASLRSNAVIRNCRFTHNTGFNGGGVYAYNSYFTQALLLFENCEFTYNTATSLYGGGLYSRYAVMQRCTFTHNYANYGGGMYIIGASSSEVTVSNCLVANNTANYMGGGIYSSASDVFIENTTVVNNTASSKGAGIYGYFNRVANSILNGNRCNGAVSNVEAANASYSINCIYSAVEGSYAGEGNIPLLPDFMQNGLYSPRFVNPSLTAGYTDSTANTDWHLQEGSPCVNRGKDSLVTIASNADLDGGVRIRHGQVDLGCYESDYDAVALPELPSNGIIIYVTPTGSGSRNGGNWNNAMDNLQSAMALAKMYGGVVWMAEGVYYGDTTVYNAFSMIEGVDVFGGFAGNEPADFDLSQRNFTDHPTILDGQNSRRVIVQPSDFVTETVWDGLTVCNGYVNSYSSNNGGGALLRGNVVFRHCLFTQNNATGHGGGVYANISTSGRSILLEDCDFSHNNSSNYGGGVYGNNTVNSKNILLENCKFTHNTASNYGGGLYGYYVVAQHCMFTHNYAKFGGGVYLANALSSEVTLSNCLIANNTANYGGGIQSNSGNTIIENATIVHNTANARGAGVYVTFGRMANSILFGNRCYENVSSVDVTNSSNPNECIYSAIEGDYPGEGNIPLYPESVLGGLFSPKFVQPSLIAGYTDSTANADWHLQDGSACVNRGSDSLVTIASNTDLDGGVRIRHGQVDLGCYESDYEATILPTFGNIVYVTQTGAGTHDGISWENAMSNIQDAILVAQTNDADVWVAEGVYYGDTATSGAFTMVEGVNVYGGFIGDEPVVFDLSQRDFTAHPTILDGQNARRVLNQTTNFATETVWDGFTVRNGYTNGDGGGASLLGNAVLRNCRFTQNTASNGGGVYAYNTYSNTTPILLENCVFTHNTVSNKGGGLYSLNTVAQQCVFTHNYAANQGGGVYIQYALSNQAAVSNCLVANNTSDYGGGIYSYPAQANVENTTVVNNTATTKGAGIYAYRIDKVANCILYGNRCNGNNSNVETSSYSGLTCVFSAIEGGYPGEGNIHLLPEFMHGGHFSPKFVHPSLSAGYTDTTTNADWHLQQGSVCVNRGSDSLVTIASNTDLDGVERVRHGQVDLGCYESDYEVTTLPDISSNGFIVYVTPTGAGERNGGSWDNALDNLLSAETLASLYGASVWVAEGVYYGDTTADNAFTMVEGVHVYGGFVGNEPDNYDLSQRDFTAHSTILDGQNARRVIYQQTEFAKATAWDGFTMRNGYASDNGGGALLRGNAVMRNCRFTHNNASNHGGGLYADGSNMAILLEKCEFTHNHASNYGGGLLITKATISNCLVANNTAQYGGGIFTNSNFAKVENTTVVNNTATYSAGIHAQNINKVANSILWGNRCGDDVSNLTIISHNNNTVPCIYTAIEGGYSGEGNISLMSSTFMDGLFHPKFVHPSPMAGYTDTTTNADWHLLEGSVCVNRGSDSLVTIASNTDLDGGERIRHGQVDLGCYESDYDGISLPQIDNIIYVTTTGAGLRDGSSWGNALDNILWADTLASLYGADVWVAEGVYYGDTTAANAFTMVEGVNVYGGFAGNEPATFDISQRNFTAHPTILDGMGVRRVLCQSKVFQQETAWDGFTIRNGHTSANDDGGGAYLRTKSILRYCTVTGNQSGHYGGGVYAQNSTLLGCVISHNNGTAGGGIYAHNSTVSNCLVANNTAGSGGGIYSYNAQVNNSTIVRNEGTSANCGAGIRISGYTNQVNNSVNNSILWGNLSLGVQDNLQGSATVTWTAVEGGLPGEGNIVLFSEDYNGGMFHPHFVHPSATAGASDTTQHADWHLESGSPCVNNGNNDFAGNYDLDGNSRVRQGTVDMGCYESDFTGNTYPQYGDIVYVTEQGTGDRSGSSWDNAAASIQYAITLAHTAGADVWVAAGTYYGDGVSANAFTMVEGVNVYGGFAGNEPENYDLDQRDFNAHPSIIDGQHVQRVLYQATDFTSATHTVWDGFTIQNGSSTDHGAGVYLRVHATLSHCIVQNNMAIYNYSLPQTGSKQYRCGAGIYVNSDRENVNSSYVFTTFIHHCTIRNNSFENHYDLGGRGAGLYAYNVKVSHTEISHNTLCQEGGGVYLSAPADFSNCLIHNNSANDGGGVCINGNNTNFINCDIVNNLCSQAGGGVYKYSYSYVTSTSVFTNCIIWGNKKNFLANNISGTCTFSHCAVEEEALTGESNLTLAAANDGADQTQYYVRFMDPANGDYQLHPSSACVNNGTNEGVADSLDFYGNPRIHQSIVDIGCSESSDESMCVSVMNLVADNVTTNSARLSWHASGNENQWLVMYGIEGGESTSITVNDTICQLTGLLFNRNYTAKVRAICGDGMMSVFSIAVNFQTICDPTVLDTLPNFSQLAPTDSAWVYNKQISFSWAAMSEATSYDFYIWADDNEEPTTPTVSGLTMAGISDYTLVGYTRGRFYHWKVVAWNECISKSSPVMTFRVNPFPDLHVSAVEYSNPVASQDMTVTWTVTNDGEGNTPPGETWNDYIWLTPIDGIGNGFWYNVSEVKLATVSNLSSLEAGQSYQNSATVTIPNDYIGSYFLFVLTNMTDVHAIDYTPTGQTVAPDPYTPSADGNPYYYLSGATIFNWDYMEEVNQNDNFFYKVISILPPPAPDLVVSSIVHGGDAISGGSANVTWTVTNQGDASATGIWRDVVYISSDTILDTEEDFRVGRFDHQGPLAVGESYQQTANFTIPVDYMGDYYFFVITDNNNSVYESLGEFNNMEMSTPITVTFTWLTDLVVTDMNLPTTVSPNGIYNIDYTVSNIGSSPTNVSYWYDRIYISAAPVFDPATALEVSYAQHYHVLNADASYTNSCYIHIPDTLTGTFHWFVVVDEHNYVFEYNAKGNNVYTHPQSTTVLLPDLQVSDIEIPGTVNPNENVVVRWTVRNNGPGDLENRSFIDQFTFNGAPFYTANANGITLAAGETLVRMANIHLPCVSGNTAAFAIQTDAEQQLIESNEDNNTRVVTVSITTPDLAVSDLTIPVGTAWSGTTANLSYHVTNNGTVNASASQVTDRFYLSNSADNWQESDLIGSYTHGLNLSPQGSSTFTYTVTLPNGISGTYYYHVVCNADSTLCENGSMSDNTANSDAVMVNLSPSPDLIITEVTAPSNVYLGADFELSYTIKNQGNAALTNTDVMQKFYYSVSPIYYDTTKLLSSVVDRLTLGVNGSVTKTTLAHLPVNTTPSVYYIHAVTDAGNVVYEHLAENNNKKVSNAVAAGVYQLDMQLAEIDGPDVVQWGQSAIYRLHVVNGTNLPTLANAWSDVLYWSEDPVLQNTDLLLRSVPHNIQMDANGDYWVEMPVTIPYGAPANVYLIGITDYGNANPDINLSNNVLAKVLTVNSVPTPDLAVEEVVVLDSLTSGQPSRIAYKVTNVGDIPMDNLTWNDKLFLSANSTYESGDIQLVTQDRSAMTLAPGASYRDTLTFTVPLPNNGALYLLMIANATNSPYEANWANNIAAVNVSVALAPPGDLVVRDVTCESTIVSGQVLHASWNVQNIGENPLSGDGLRSLVYVSTDTVFDAADRLLGSVTSSIDLPIDQMVQQSVTGKISGVRPGEYYLIIKTDVTNAFNEADDNNNTGHSIMPFTVTIRPLPFNTDVAETLVNNEISDFLLEVGDNVNQTVRIRLTSSDSLLGAMNVIYVTYNDIGDNFNYTYSTIGQFTANSVLYIPATEPGYYGVSLSGSTPSGTTQNVVIRADILPFELHAVNADHGGNTGKVTVELTGSRFRPGMTVSLRNGGEEIIADSLIYVNYYQCFATFDLTNSTPGVYDVSVFNNCEGEAVLQNGFTIEDGTPTEVSYNLLFPSSPRPNRSVVMMLEFGNTGNIDLYDQVLEITSIGGSPIALTPDGISQNQTVLLVPLSIDGEPEGLLRPGIYGTLNIYGFTSGALIFSIKSVSE
jgi:hypothetical protein